MVLGALYTYVVLACIVMDSYFESLLQYCTSYSSSYYQSHLCELCLAIRHSSSVGIIGGVGKTRPFTTVGADRPCSEGSDELGRACMDTWLAVQVFAMKV
jgi:hypothetical protein